MKNTKSSPIGQCKLLIDFLFQFWLQTITKNKMMEVKKYCDIF